MHSKAHKIIEKNNNSFFKIVSIFISGCNVENPSQKYYLFNIVN